MQKVTDPNLLQQLNGSGQVAPRPMQQPTAPGIITGRPKQPSPIEQQRIAMEAERLRMAQEDQARQNQQGDLSAQNTTLDIAKKQREVSAGPAAGASEGERKASGFLKRALNAENSYLNIDADPDARGQQQIEGRSVPGLVFSDKFPTIANAFSDTPRQLADQAQREFIAAVLRYDSGAAIPPEEFVTNAKIYYPQPNDSPEVIAQKAESRRVAINGLRDSSGIMAPQSVATPEAAAEMTQGIAGAFNPQGSAPTDGPPQGPTGNFAATVNTDALGPGEKFLFDETGTPIAIQAADGSISGYSSIIDNASERDARQRLIDNGDMDYAKGGEAGLNRGVMLGLSDEIGGVAAGLGSLARGGEFGKGYREARDTERVAQDISREEAGIAPELLGGLLIPGGALGTAKNVGQFVKQGATIGAIGGFGEGRGAVNSLMGAGVGAATGAALGGVASQAPRAVNALLQTGPGQKLSAAVGRTRPNVDREVIEAGARQDIRVRLPDAVESKRPAMAALQKTNTGSPRVGAAYAEDVNATQSALGRQVPDGSTARDENTLGKAIQGALERKNTEGKAKTSALFNRVEKMAPGARSDGAGTVQMIDDEISRLNSVGKRGNASKVKALQDMRDDIAESGLTVESLQSLRASVRQRVNDNNLDPSSADTLFASVDKAATKELEGALQAANPRAVGAFQSANRSHAERLAFRKEVARELLGPKANPLDAEKAATRLMSKIASKGDEDGFKRVWDAMDAAERGDVAATLVERFAGGEKFSFSKLADNIENANPRTLREVFGKDGFEALKDIRLIARRKAQTAQGLNNSNTGSVVESKANGLLDTILTVFGYTQGGITGAVVGAAVRPLGEKAANSWRSRLLLNPDFTKWLKAAPNTTNPAAIDRYFDRLNKIASREQAFLMDARQMQDFLAKQFSEGVGRAAATGDNTEDNGRK